jgi:hypothetical protein
MALSLYPFLASKRKYLRNSSIDDCMALFYHGVVIGRTRECVAPKSTG